MLLHYPPDVLKLEEYFRDIPQMVDPAVHIIIDGITTIHRCRLRFVPYLK